MPTQPRIARAQPTGPITHAPDPVPVLLVLRWASLPAELVPGHAHAWTTGPRPAVEVEWWWRHPTEGGNRRDWFPAWLVLREQPTAEEWADLSTRPVWMA